MLKYLVGLKTKSIIAEDHAGRKNEKVANSRICYAESATIAGTGTGAAVVQRARASRLARKHGPGRGSCCLPAFARPEMNNAKKLSAWCSAERIVGFPV